MLKKNNLVVAVTYVLSGSLLQFISGVSDNWSANLVTVFGFILFLAGLSKLRPAFDRAGQSAIVILMVSAGVGGLAGLVDMIPFAGIAAGILYLFAFLTEAVGYFMLRSSGSLGPRGKSGITMMLIALLFGVLQALFDMIPFFGGMIASVLALVSLVMVFFAWIQVQEDILNSLYGDQ